MELAWWLLMAVRLFGTRAKSIHHDDVIKWKHFTRYWPFMRGIHWSPVNSPHKEQWREALMFSLICVWNNSWVNNGDTGDLWRHRIHYDVIVMYQQCPTVCRTADMCRFTYMYVNAVPQHMCLRSAPPRGDCLAINHLTLLDRCFWLNPIEKVP